MAKNHKIKAANMPAGTYSELSEDQQIEKRTEHRTAKGSVFSQSTEKLARDTFCMKNHPIPKGKQMFPLEWRMQYVDCFYSNARDEAGKPAPLYIDLPMTTHEIAMCERKLKIIKGIRYTYMKIGEGEWEGQLRLDGQDPDKIKADQRMLAAREEQLRSSGGSAQ